MGERTELWFTEKYTENWGLTLRIERWLHSEESDFQSVDVLETAEFGKLLALDGAIMFTESDEFAYHEMLVHVPILTHPRPERVLVVGGGDGGTLRELSRHPEVKEMTQVEIDERVIQVSKRFFPTLAIGFEDPRVKLKFADGIKFVHESPPGEFDVILVDSTDPKGPSEGLFTEKFYASCEKALNEDGILTVQSGSPYFQLDLITRVYKAVSLFFPITRVYLSGVMAYGGLWSFTLGSKRYDPTNGPLREINELKYYTPRIHTAALQLPKYLEKALLD